MIDYFRLYIASQSSGSVIGKNLELELWGGE